MMNNIEFVLYAAVIAILLISQANWAITLISILIILAVIISKSSGEEKIKTINENTEKILGSIAERLEKFSEKIGEIKTSTEKGLIGIENSIIEFRNEYRAEIDSSYRDLARRLAETEQKIESIKKTMGSAVGMMEERIEEIEEDKQL